ncbi:MAG: sigma-70 family RNA polymerase sigma factor [Hyphomicrobiaceae bacterium]|nr:sigma-70 family RNA polymerase sigma factor [Hyphomicrobiaceae bacterium]
MELDYVAALEGCARGEKQALRQLYDAEAGRLIAVAQRIVRRRELAEEVVQDAFIQVWRKAATFDPALGSARGWIYAIVRNRALNVVRDGSREDLVDADTLDAAREGQGVVADAYEKLGQGSRLRDCLEVIDKEKRESVLLAYVAGYTHGEIAGQLGVPLGTAKSWVRRGLAALKDCMA